MQKTLAKYKIGLGIIAIFTIVTAIIAFSQAGANKADNATFALASSIATKLQSYTDANGEIPDNLIEAGVRSVPASITYAKLSASKYRFCVDYKTSSTDFNGISAASSLLLQSELQNAEGSSGSGSNVNFGADGFLYINPDHHKGENCQTVSLASGGLPNQPAGAEGSFLNGSSVNGSSLNGSSLGGSSTGSSTGSQDTISE